MTKVTLLLRGMGILVTRPAHQADELCRLIETKGGKAIRFPALEILAPENSKPVQALIDRLDTYDLAIFVSANAVNWAMQFIAAREDWLPPDLKLVAIGKTTAQELEKCGARVHLVPKHTFNSETLLNMPEMQAVAEQRIVIFRGEGGRDLLGDTLRQRGARVTYAEVYRRSKPSVCNKELLQYWTRGQIQAVVVTSNQSLQNLFDMVGELGRQWLCDTPLVVVSARARQLALELGFRFPPLIAREANDEAIVEALLRLRHQALF